MNKNTTRVINALTTGIASVFLFVIGQPIIGFALACCMVGQLSTLE